MWNGVTYQGSEVSLFMVRRLRSLRLLFLKERTPAQDGEGGDAGELQEGGKNSRKYAAEDKFD